MVVHGHDRGVLEAGGDGLLDRVRSASPAFGRAVDDALTRFGHRGPGECELANKTFADDPDMLLRAVAGSITSGEVAARGDKLVIPRRARRLVRMAARATAERERCRDRVVVIISILRSLVREQGRRLVDAGVIEDIEDVFHLTYDELWDPPADARAVVARRTSERERLAALRMPTAFSGRWEPIDDASQLAVGDAIEGVPASPGTVRGVVRIVSAADLDDLEPGEILVANVTDVGYTPLFGHAGAVVTDIGGAMSHAAVVAREFGIPAVVDTADATGRLADGMEVEVDGRAGTVTRVS